MRMIKMMIAGGAGLAALAAAAPAAAQYGYANPTGTPSRTATVNMAANMPMAA